MKRILESIEPRTKSELEFHPLITSLSPPDESESAESAETKLRASISCFTYFVFTFKDHNRLVLNYPAEEAASDPLKSLMNEHIIPRIESIAHGFLTISNSLVIPF
jgi:hypothetical protein